MLVGHPLLVGPGGHSTVGGAICPLDAVVDLYIPARLLLTAQLSVNLQLFGW